MTTLWPATKSASSTVETLLATLLASPTFAQAPFKLAPAVAVEAEDFAIDKGWKVLKNGEGNYMVDIIGFCHISGERLLHLPAHWPWRTGWEALWNNVIGYCYPTAQPRAA